MARRPSLTDASIIRPSQALKPPPSPALTDDAESRRSPARQGKKAIAFWVDPGASTQLRMAGVSMNRSVQDIMTEALGDWFTKHRLPGLAAEGQSREQGDTPRRRTA
jgi:hypothetical protein